MPTPKKGYRLNGKVIPSTTTIIDRFKDYSGLKLWYFYQGVEQGRANVEIPSPFLKTAEAAGVGTAAHAMVEARIKGLDPYKVKEREGLSSDQIMMAGSSFLAYESWAENFEVKIVEQEIQLVSKDHAYGGTPDAIGLIGNQLVLLDWKTSNAIYEDHLYQLAAYKNLWEENNPSRPLTGGFHLLRFSKENGDFAHHFYPSLETEWRAFLLMRELYEISKATKKRAS